LIDYNHKYLLAREFLATEALRLAEPGKLFKLSSGRESEYYVDCRKVVLSSVGARLVGKGFALALRKLLWDVGQPPPISGPGVCLGATGVGGQALLGATLACCDMVGLRACGFVDRGEAKKHGLNKRFEGHVPDELPVVLLDDTLTTGGTLLELAEAVREKFGRLASAALYVVDRQEGGWEALNIQGIMPQALLSAAELLELTRPPKPA